jgi:hypothetical protein
MYDIIMKDDNFEFYNPKYATVFFPFASSFFLLLQNKTQDKKLVARYFWIGPVIIMNDSKTDKLVTVQYYIIPAE